MMLKISKRASVHLSLAIAVAFFAVLVVGICYAPTVSEILMWIAGERMAAVSLGKTLVLMAIYAVIAIAMLADGLLFALLLRVRDGRVFSAGSVALIRGISWCSAAVGLVFAGLGYCFPLALIVAVAALFLALSVRVVKNVIEEATAIKSENDLTV